MGKIAFGSLLTLMLFLISPSPALSHNGTEVGNGMTAGVQNPLSVLDEESMSDSGLIWTCFTRFNTKGDVAEDFVGETLASRDQALESSIHACEDAHQGESSSCSFDGCSFAAEEN